MNPHLTNGDGPTHTGAVTGLNDYHSTWVAGGNRARGGRPVGRGTRECQADTPRPRSQSSAPIPPSPGHLFDSALGTLETPPPDPRESRVRVRRATAEDRRRPRGAGSLQGEGRSGGGDPVRGTPDGVGAERKDPRALPRSARPADPREGGGGYGPSLRRLQGSPRPKGFIGTPPSLRHLPPFALPASRLDAPRRPRRPLSRAPLPRDAPRPAVGQDPRTKQG